MSALEHSPVGLKIVPGQKYLEHLCTAPLFENRCQSPFSLFLSPFSFLADLMDNSELIRNVTLCGHLHHGKVRELGTGLLFVSAEFFSLRVTNWGLRP